MAKAQLDVKQEIELTEAESLGELEILGANTSVADQKRIKTLVAEINIDDSMSVISFGSSAQKELSEKSKVILSGVRNKDTGPAGELISDIVLEIRGMGANELKPGEEQGWLSKMLRQVTPAVKFMQKYETVESQIEAILSKMDTERRKLSRDVIMIDGMYDGALDFFNELAYYIEAGELKLVEVQTVDIPALRAKAEKTGDMLDAQAVRDLTEKAHTLEIKVHDLKLTKQATMQLLPRLRMIQDVDSKLIMKLESIESATIPMWEQQIGMAIIAWRQAEATKVIKGVTDVNNELMLSNSKLLKETNAAARTEIERGIVDIETIKTVNNDLIETLIESIEIAEMGSAARASANDELIKCENDLKQAMLNAQKQLVESTD